MSLASIGGRTLFRSIVLIVAIVVTGLMAGTPVRRAGAAAVLSDEQVQKLLMAALDNIGRGMWGDNKRCAPATPEEKANPPITIVEARLVTYRAALSAAAELCGLDWQGRNFLPMMAYWRRTVKKNERQMAVIGILHGIMQGLGKPDACTADIRATVERQLTFQP